MQPRAEGRRPYSDGSVDASAKPPSAPDKTRDRGAASTAASGLGRPVGS